MDFTFAFKNFELFALITKLGSFTTTNKLGEVEDDVNDRVRTE